jgi:hypothetical protein
VGITDIEIVYSRPGVKGREIFGGLVSYGDVWRTGANFPTKLSFSTDVRFGGKDVPAGTYALFTVPGKKEWEVILTRNTELWGSFGYDRKDDFVVLKVTPGVMATPVETFLIDINDIRDGSATLNLIWETTIVTVPIEVEFVDQVMANIEAVMATEGGQKPYFESAAFYLEHGQDLGKANEWINAAIEGNPEGYWIYLVKARIEAKRGNKAAAIAASERSLELATAAGDNGYIAQNKQLLSSLK